MWWHALPERDFSLMAASVNSYEFLDPPAQSGELGVLGHYRVLDELGKGGMGFVFLAEDTKLKRSVALKVMNQKIAATPHSRRRFLHEARAMAAVHHDNVATIFEVGESKGTPFMAMEMLKGCTLEEFNQTKTQLGFETIIEYARQIARGLTAAHANGIVHRDIKPANIWIEEGKERVKILDFGLALASTPVDHLAGRGAVIGTPGYLSPEQARSEPLDDRSDLYSLGVVLYEMCTGQLPILSKSVPGQLISILAHRPKPIYEINPEIPKPLCDLVHKLLRKEPRSRPSSAAKLAEDLDQVETECHAKTEVAQAISKLQMGLSEVVSKKESEFLFDAVEEIDEPVLDPLGTSGPVMMIPPAKPVVKAAPAATAPAWKPYWPVAAAIGVVVLIAAPLLWFALSGSGDIEVAAVPPVQPSTPTNGSAVPIPAGGQPTTSGQDAQRPAPSTQDSAQQDKQPSTAQGGGQKSQGGGAAKKRGKRGSQQAGKTQQTSGGSEKPKETDSKPDQPSKPPANTLAANPVSTTKPDSDPGPPPKKDVTPPPTPVDKPPVEMVHTTISTADGHGADAMVEKGTKEKLGLKPSIGILKRGRVETAHSYLRFDLTKVADVIKYVKEAELILTVVGSQRPVGATIRVVGVRVENEQPWPEAGIEWSNSYSISGFESLPILAEITVSRDNADPRDRGQNLIRISSPELAEFVAGSPRSRVTLALAGSGIGSNKVLRFVSRDYSVTQAPKLIVLAPKEAPPEDKKKKSRR